jgi:pimeloyl-ACP methyl ester carboxylesterase
MSTDPRLGSAGEVTLGAGTVRYRERGEGPPLLFVHGLLTNADLWRGVVPELAANFRCVAPDWPLGSHQVPMRPGADLTPSGIAEVINEFIGALDLERVVVVANDTGGAIAQILATTHPERIGGLVLTSCDCFENFLPPMFRYLQLAGHLPGALLVLLNALRVKRLRALPIAYGWLAQRIPATASDSYLRPGLASRAIRRDTAKFLRAVSARYTVTAAQRLREFAAPTLVAWGGDDRFFPVEHGRRLAELIPNARFEIIPGARTFTPEDRPEALASLIATFGKEVHS